MCTHHPSPGAVLYQSTTNKRTEGGANGEHGEDHPHEVSSFPQWEEITDDHVYHYIDTTSTNSLDCPASDHHGRVDSTAADTATEYEEGHRADHQPSSSEQIGGLSKKGLEASTGD